MKILYLTPAFQHPSMRGPTRHYYFIQELSKRHEITLLALSRTPIAPEAMQEMSNYTKKIMTFPLNGDGGTLPVRLLGSVPKVGGRYRQYARHQASLMAMKVAFQDLSRREKFDLVLFHGKSMFKVIADWNELPLVVDFCDATSMRVLSKMEYAGKKLFPLLAMRYLQIRQIERRLVSKSPFLAFVSWRDREFVMGQPPAGEVVPIGVDHQFWQRKGPLSQSKTLIFTGVMNYAPNDDAATYLIDRVLPIVRRAVPEIEVLIVGRDPSAALKSKAHEHDGVDVTGFVDDLRPYLERAVIFAAPMRFGSGVQNKVLEAMAMQVPVVTTPIVAAGLRVDGANVPPVQVAQGAEAFAQKIITLLADVPEQAHLAKAGREFVKNHFVWERSARKLEELCLRAANNGAKPSVMK